MDVVQIIQTLGFPIACVVACAFFIYKIIMRDKDEAAAREDKLTEANEKISEALNKISDTIEETNELNKDLSETNRMLVEKVEGKLTNLNNNMDKVLEKLSQ